MDDQPKTPPRQADEQSTPPPDSLATGAAERVATIIDAVERAAAGVIDDAEAQAREYLDDARVRADRLGAERLRAVAEMTDTLVAQAEIVKRQSDALIDALDEAMQGVGRLSAEGDRSGPDELRAAADPAASEPGTDGESPGEERRKHLQPVDASAGRGEDPEPQERSAGSSARSAGTRLLVTQMSMSGSTRQEIESRLRNELGVEDAAPILDSILGPER